MNELNREILLTELQGIGWSLKSKMNGYAYKLNDHEGKESKFLLHSDCVEVKDETAGARFYYSRCITEKIDDNCISLYPPENDSVFINFYGVAQVSESRE